MHVRLSSASKYSY
ncbi:hypothetical protein CP8484711_1275A, partial [Chlamydia psittaci 84-8471/1]